MLRFKQILAWAGGLSFGVALFQAAIGFSPSLSLYFGAPEALVENTQVLIIVSLFISLIIVLFGVYALSGAGYIRPLPWLKYILMGISGIYILRGLLLIPEILVVFGALDISIPVAPRFVFFSLGSMFIGLMYLRGTIGGWHTFSAESARPSGKYTG